MDGDEREGVAAELIRLGRKLQRMESAHALEIAKLREEIGWVRAGLGRREAETPGSLAQVESAASDPVPDSVPPPLPGESGAEGARLGRREVGAPGTFVEVGSANSLGVPDSVPPPLPSAIRAVEDHELSAGQDMRFRADPRPMVAELPSVACLSERREVGVDRGERNIRSGSDGSSLEEQFGRVWLVRIGIALLVTGVVLLGNYAYQNWIRELSNGARLAALVLAGLGMAETGRRISRKATLATFGEVVMAGGLAVIYYCVYAAYRVDALRVISDPVVAAVSLFCAAAGIAWISWQRQARATALMALVLASYATSLQPVGWLAGFSNLLLAAAGAFLLSRRGWATPGVVSMLGIYLSYIGWQLAWSGGLRAETVQIPWPLVPVWAMFAYAGLRKSSEEAVGVRGLRWFTAVNHGLFFAIFLGAWVIVRGTSDAWLVTGVFGAVWLVLGLLARRKSLAVSGVCMSQGLAALSAALVIKLDGYHLGLALATEAFILAWAHARYRGRAELGFAMLAASGSALLVAFPGSVPSPAWSLGLCSLLIAAAAVVLRVLPSVAEVSNEPRDRVQDQIRAEIVSKVMWWIAVGSALVTCEQLDDRLRAPVALALGLAVACAPAVVLRVSRSEILLASSAFGGFAALVLWRDDSVLGLGIGAALAVLAAWRWHALERKTNLTSAAISEPGKLERSEFEAQQPPPLGFFRRLGETLPATIFSVVAVLAIGRAVDVGAEDLRLTGWICAAFLIAVVAVATRSGRLVWWGNLLTMTAVVGYAVFSELEPSVAWVGLLVMAANALLLAWPGPARGLRNFDRAGALKAARATVLAVWCVVWRLITPAYWFDAVGASAPVLLVVVWGLVRIAKLELVKVPWEALGSLAVGLFFGLQAVLGSPWRMTPGWSEWTGGGVLVGVLLSYAIVQAIWRNRQRIGDEAISRTREAIGLALWSYGTLWITEMVVARHGWEFAGVLWTVMGFLAVSAGLALRHRLFRWVGFVLLAGAILKLFVQDVWDFTAFTRVIAFLALGLALVLLGAFYHRFSEMMRRWLVGDSTDPQGDKSGENPEKIGDLD